MSTPEESYRAVAAAEDMIGELAGLEPGELRGLIAWLRGGHGRGVQGYVLALAELEAVERFLKPTE